MKQETIDKILELFERDRIYLVSSLKLRDLADMTGEDLRCVEGDFENDFGYSFSEMVSIWRTCCARDLLVSGKVPYELIWKFSGHKSIKHFEREWDKLVK